MGAYAPTLNPPPFDPDFEEDSRSRRRIWIGVSILALLLHFIFFVWAPQFDLPKAPPRVELQEVNPQKLEAIRRQWKEKSILLDRGQKQDVAPPEDARYISQHNIRVQKEQRARQSDVIPRPAIPGAEAEKKTESSHKSSKALTQQPIPSLGNLGVPFNLQKQVQRVQDEKESQEMQEQRGQTGGDQSVLDPNLPQGAENMLNAQESVYYSFYARIYETIGPIWSSLIREIPNQRRVTPGDYVTVVDVVLDSAGNLLEIRRLQASAISDFDKAVDQAWRRVGHFSNPPRGLLDQNGVLHMGWTFHVHMDDGMNLFSAPPQRNY